MTAPRITPRSITATITTTITPSPATTGSAMRADGTILPKVEFRGWFVLSESPYAADTGTLDERLAELGAKLDALDWQTITASLYAFNGFPTLVIGGHVKQVRREYYEAEALVGWVGEHLPGSYGALWRRGDAPEATDGREYEVLVMRRGTVVSQRDPFFRRPAAQALEDSY
jgi:hypothetical protein